MEYSLNDILGGKTDLIHDVKFHLGYCSVIQVRNMHICQHEVVQSLVGLGLFSKEKFLYFDWFQILYKCMFFERSTKKEFLKAKFE
jgi:hypothetical protein